MWQWASDVASTGARFSNCCQWNVDFSWFTRWTSQNCQEWDLGSNGNRWRKNERSSLSCTIQLIIFNNGSFHEWDNFLSSVLPWISKHSMNSIPIALISNNVVSGVGGQLRILNMYRELGESFPVVGPSVGVGDALVFTKCTIHSCSGDNSLGLARHAWQIRFFSEPQVLVKPF